MNEQPYGLAGMFVCWFVIAMLVIAFSCLTGLWYVDLIERFAR